MEPATIAAIATPPGSGGIGIIRISGAASQTILTDIFRPSGEGSAQGPISSTRMHSHRLYMGNIVDPGSNTRVDEVLAVVMRSPKSYTMEDVVEIQSHSGYIVLNKILKLVLGKGARLAEPGEFTRRAYMNGRIDLTQAEAVIDIINARTGRSLELAAEQLKGGIGRQISAIRDCILSVLAEIEANIEFADDIDGADMDMPWGESIKNDVVAPLDRLIAAYEQNHYFRDGIRMAIVGRPNVGKSSLLNRLTRKERAIVTEIPGTTRDTIEEMINIEGLPVILIDTAGLHDTTQQIEMIGIERTHATIKSADIVLFVVDSSQGVKPDDYAIFTQLGGVKHIIVMNKVDLNSNMALPPVWAESAAVRVSALEGTHIEALKEGIFNMGVGQQANFSASSIVPNLRQVEGLENARQLASHALAVVQRESELATVDLKEAMGALDRILGLSCSEEVLDRIFKQFCIGK